MKKQTIVVEKCAAARASQPNLRVGLSRPDGTCRSGGAAFPTLRRGAILGCPFGTKARSRFGTGMQEAFALMCATGMLLTGCSTTKHAPKPAKEEKIHERAWIGGQYKFARRSSMWIPFAPSDAHLDAFPASLGHSNRAGIFIKSLSTNTPAYQAGLREGDLILAVGHQPVKSLKTFWHSFDETHPGATLTMEAWRDGQRFECNVIVGRETFKDWGMFAVGIWLPSLSKIGPFDLWPDPGFDLVALGFQAVPERKELHSPEGRFRRACQKNGEFTAYDQDWRAWLAIFSLQKGKNVLAQESVPPQSASASGLHGSEASAAGRP